MKAVLDTNVVVSGVFFGGVPGTILDAWHNGRLDLVLSVPILAEYREVGADLESRYGGSELEAFAALLLLNSEVVDAPEALPEPVCSDPDDDKFLACAIAAGASVVVSGDAALLKVSGWNGIHVLKPRTFLADGGRISCVRIGRADVAETIVAATPESLRVRPSTSQLPLRSSLAAIG